MDNPLKKKEIKKTGMNKETLTTKKNQLRVNEKKEKVLIQNVSQLH